MQCDRRRLDKNYGDRSKSWVIFKKEVVRHSEAAQLHGSVLDYALQWLLLLYMFLLKVTYLYYWRLLPSYY